MSEPKQQSDIFPPRFAVAAALVLALLAQALLYARGFHALSADDSARVLAARGHGLSALWQPGWWPPLPAMVQGLLLELWPDLFRAPRLLAGLVGLAVVPAVGRLAARLFADRAVSGAAVVLAALYAPRLVFAMLPLAEIWLTLFAVLAAADTAAWLREDSPGLLRRAAVWSLFAAMSRYEGWLLAAALAMLALVAWRRGVAGRRLGGSDAAGTVLVAAVFPVYWLAAAALGGRLALLGEASRRYDLLQGGASAVVWRHTHLFQFLRQAATTPIVAGAAALTVWWLRSSRVRWWSSLMLFPLLGMSALALATHSLPSHNWGRLAAPWLVMLLPFLAWLLEKAAAALAPPGPGRRALLACAVVVFLAGFWDGAASVAARSDMTRDDLRAGRAAAAMVADGPGRILLDSSHWSHLHLQVASGIPDRFLLNTGYDPRLPGPSILPDEALPTPEALRNLGLDLLVFRDPERVRALAAAGLEQAAAFGPWRLFRIPPAGS